MEFEIYEPEEDSYLLSKYVDKFVSKNDKILEIGIGSGIQCETAINKIKKEKGNGVVIGVDINKKAVEKCKFSEHTKDGIFLESNLFEVFNKKTINFQNKKIVNKFNLIIFNPPYLPDAKDPEEIKYITTGGKHGYEIIEEFLKDVSNFLEEDGKILIVFSSLTKKNKVDEIIKKYLFEYELLEEQSMFFEKLFCYKITKSRMLKNLESYGIKNISYLAKGKRGFVFTATINNPEMNFQSKKCIIKVQNSDTKALNVIEKEINWTKRVNELNIGPKFYFSNLDFTETRKNKLFYNKEEFLDSNSKLNFIVREFIEGDLILDWIEKNKKNKKLVVDVLIDIINQCYLLDKNLLEKKELTRPVKHIIISKENKATQIDFERMKITQNPSNVTQFIQFLSSNNINKNINFNKDKLRELAKIYYDKKNDLNFNKIINYLKSIVK